MYNYKATVKRVVDGDTVDLIVDLGFGVTFVDRFRLSGIDTPEIYQKARDSAEYIAGMKAKERVLQLMPEGSTVEITTFKDKKDLHGRYIAEIFNTEHLNINATLLAEGLARKYVG